MEEPKEVYVGTTKFKVYRDGTVIGPRGKPIKPANNGNGYFYVVAQKKRIGIHRVVAHAYLDAPLTGINIWVHHKDGNRENNAVDNLEVTKRYDYDVMCGREKRKPKNKGWDKLAEQLKDKLSEV